MKKNYRPCASLRARSQNWNQTRLVLLLLHGKTNSTRVTYPISTKTMLRQFSRWRGIFVLHAAKLCWIKSRVIVMVNGT